MNVLIAEDERVTRRMLERQLQSWGHEVVAVEDGRAAWDSFRDGEFPVVISDWNMPGMDGLELVRKIRGTSSRGYVYLILLTAKSEKADVVVGMEAGADDFLSKPFNRHELRVRLNAGERIIRLERSLADRNALLEQSNARMKSELQAAAKVQRALLPSDVPQIPGAEITWNFQPCDELAGDILNVFRLDEKHVGLYVADVSGHGVAASLLSVSVSRVLTPEPSASSLLVQSPRGEDSSHPRIVPPADVARELNRRFPMEDSDGKYFTIAYGVLNTETYEFRYVSAGHPPLLHVPHGKHPQFVAASGFAVGWFPEVEFQDCRLQLAPGDRLCVYSDGVPEAMSPDLTTFGEQRLANAFGRGRSQTVPECVRDLMKDVAHWCGPGGPKDDASVVALEVLR